MIEFPAGLHPLDQPLNRLVFQLAATAGLEIYLVGGYLRDAILSRLAERRAAKDLDYAVAGGSAVDFARAVAESLGGHFVLLDAENDTARVVLEDGAMLDFAGCVGGGIESDVARRDFTVNALAWHPEQPDEVIDLVGGLADIATRTIRAVKEENLTDDPLRMLRAFRFAAALGGTIDEATERMIRRHSALLSQVKAERVSYELFEVARGERTADFFTAMGESGILEAIFPELTPTRRVPPNAFHHLGLWDHSLEAVRQAELRLPALPSWVRQDLSCELAAAVSRLQAAKVACLLHDIGKPDTWEVTAEGRHTFYGHDRSGAEMCEQAARRLKWARPLERLVVKLVRWHLRPGQLFHQGPPSDRALRRFFRTMGEDLPSLIFLALGDLGATCGPGIEADRAYLESRLVELLERYLVFVEGERRMVRFLDGSDVMKLLGIKPGPAIGELLSAVEEAQALGEVTSREEAERYLVRLYADRSAK